VRIFILEDEIDWAPRNQLKEVLKKHDLTLARSCPDAIANYKSGTYDLLLLDHDMEGKFESPEHPNTGTQFVKWLVLNDTPILDKETPRLVILHSHNVDGKKNMKALLEQAGWSVISSYFDSKYVKAIMADFGDK
jgi:hypothetical protein